MAFQPIVDLDTGAAYAYEALVRPPGGGSAAEILNQIDANNCYAFDQACRVKAIELAARLEMSALLSINFLPNAVYQPAACLAKTFEAAERVKFPLYHLMFEVTENEPARDVGHLQSIFKEYKKHGMITAIDDFGAGYAGVCCGGRLGYGNRFGDGGYPYGGFRDGGFRDGGFGRFGGFGEGRVEGGGPEGSGRFGGGGFGGHSGFGGGHGGR